ncbi:MAG TPA: hypothetical protein VHB68_05595 [Steroidobacteraceae bacterium]|nr:hypothetical protein [Steroidobacteraceae bacterium]
MHTNIHGRALRPSDPDFPSINSNPQKIVDFAVKVPPSVSAQFSIYYSVELITHRNADGSVDWFESPHGCRWRTANRFYVELPLQLTKDGDIYRGKFALDQFEPGNCGWHFDRMLSPMLRYPLVVYRGDYNDRPGDQTDIRLDIWCTRKSKGHPHIDPRRRHDLNQVNNCADLVFAAGAFTDVPRALWDSVPIDARMNGGPGFIARHARSISVEFHDLDELIPSYPDRRQ